MNLSSTTPVLAQPLLVAESDEADLPGPGLTTSAAMPAIVAPLTASSANLADVSDAARDVSAPDDSSIDADEPDDTAVEVASDGPPLALEDLDDPFLDALIRKEQLSA